MGFITKISVAASLFALIVFLGAWFMTTVGNQYDITQQDIYQDRYNDLSEQIDTIVYESADLQEGADIDQETQDTAQYKGAISSVRESLDIFSVAKNGINDLAQILPAHTAIWGTLLTILTICLIFAGYYALRGVLP